MSRQKIIIIVIACLIVICLVVVFALFKPKEETLTLYGEYSQIETTNKKTAYQKSYLMMDCFE